MIYNTITIIHTFNGLFFENLYSISIKYIFLIEALSNLELNIKNLLRTKRRSYLSYMDYEMIIRFSDSSNNLLLKK